MKIGTHSSSFFQWKVTNLNRFILSIASVRCRFLYLVIAACHVKDASGACQCHHGQFGGPCQVALIGDNDAKDLSRRCFRLAEIFIEEQTRRR